MYAYTQACDFYYIYVLLNICKEFNVIELLLYTRDFAIWICNFFIYVLFYVLLNANRKLDALALLLYTRNYDFNIYFDYLRVIEIRTKNLRFLLYRKRLQHYCAFVIKR